MPKSLNLQSRQPAHGSRLASQRSGFGPATRAAARHAQGFALAALTLATLALAGTAHAQISTSTIKGQIAGAASSGVAVVAVNKATGATWRTTARADGSYVLIGLAPGDYEIRISSGTGAPHTHAISVAVGETAALDMSLGSTQQVIVTGSALRQDAKGSEVGTVVSRRLIEALPQTTRNFLSSADLAPGVAFSTDAGGNTKIQAGAQNFDHVNVFIDGVGQKNNILRGGLSGQDSSRGNPFPQSAIAEYRVLSQNYKAEFDQVSSVAISAVTRSGSNTLSGEAYVDRTGTDWRALSVFEKEREAQGVKLPPSSKREFGFSLGGPIVRDQVHFFFAYDGKKIDDSRQILPRELGKLPNLGFAASVKGFAGSQVDTFNEDLLFGKVDVQLGGDQRVSASLRLRRESDRVAESRDLSAPGNDRQRKNDETRFDLKHEWTLGDWLSEARLGYEDYTWNPRAALAEPFVIFKVSTASPQRLNGSADVIFAGGSPDAQNRAQKGTFFSEDLTYTGLKGHVLKGGLKLKAMKYDLSGTAFGVDRVEVLIDTVSGNPFLGANGCTGTNITNGGLNSDQCLIRPAIPGAAANFSNTQWGLYLQDDWTVTRALEVNAGVRWDYESNMLNNDYVTPADRVTALRALDVERWGIRPPAGQTYAQSLAKGGVNINDYISNGNSRKAFTGALAPRVGFSLDLTGDRNTVLFGGYGRSYSRTMANHALDERQKNQQAGGEIWLMRNDLKVPFADQLSLGVRQGVGRWNLEAAVSRIDAKNQFIWFGGNRDANGGYANQSPIDPLWGGPNGYGTLILGDTVGRARTDALLLKAEKPYTRSSGWSANFAYTYSDAKTTHKEWNNDIFDWTYGRPGVRGLNPSTLVAEHRLVAAGMADSLLPWGLTVAGKMSWDSGLPRRITSCAAGWDKCISVKGEATDFNQLDVSVSKALLAMGHTFSLRLDVLNLLNKTNYGGFDDWGGGPGNPQNAVGGDNANLGKPNSIRGDTRTYRLALSVKF